MTTKDNRITALSPPDRDQHAGGRPSLSYPTHFLRNTNGIILFILTCFFRTQFSHIMNYSFPLRAGPQSVFLYSGQLAPSPWVWDGVPGPGI